ncbi:NUDIX hydrolase [Bacillus sp. JJ1609]|uniref:NUDIX hydrolase n=1 Tax=Bacillus sp. JJ1609 TaxID=3122977 RepID=UPI002FFFAA70
MERVDVAYALIYLEDEKKILMVNNVGSGWSLPGGAVEPGETLEQAVVREANEETGLILEAVNIVAINEMFQEDKGVHAVFFTFNTKIIGGDIAINDAAEISEIKWVDLQTANALMPFHPEGVEFLLQSSAPYHFQQ